jgi:hypothetical protein
MYSMCFNISCFGSNISLNIVLKFVHSVKHAMPFFVFHNNLINFGFDIKKK